MRMVAVVLLLCVSTARALPAEKGTETRTDPSGRGRCTSADLTTYANCLVKAGVDLSLDSGPPKTKSACACIVDCEDDMGVMTKARVACSDSVATETKVGDVSKPGSDVVSSKLSTASLTSEPTNSPALLPSSMPEDAKTTQTPTSDEDIPETSSSESPAPTRLLHPVDEADPLDENQTASEVPVAVDGHAASRMASPQASKSPERRRAGRQPSSCVDSDKAKCSRYAAKGRCTGSRTWREFMKDFCCGVPTIPFRDTHRYLMHGRRCEEPFEREPLLPCFAHVG